jgi:hypothetical protein
VQAFRHISLLLKLFISRKDVILVMGDLNAKVGSNNEGLEHIMGKHGLGYIN